MFKFSERKKLNWWEYVSLTNTIRIPDNSKFISVLKYMDTFKAMIKLPEKIESYKTYRVILCFDNDIHISHKPTFLIGKTIYNSELLSFFAEEISSDLKNS